MNELVVLLVNCRSIKNKVDDFADLINTTAPSVVIGTESWLDDTIDDAEVFPPEYAAYRRDRNRHGGGVFLLIHNSLQSLAVDFSNFSFEAVMCKVSLLNGEFLVIGSFYRPPATSDESIQLLTNALSSISFDYLVLGGDFNFPDIQWDEGLPSTSNSSVPYQSFINFTSSFSLHQHVSVPTRLDPRRDSTLDLIFSNESSIISSVSAIPGISDHMAVIGQIKCAKKAVARMPPRKTFPIRSR